MYRRLYMFVCYGKLCNVKGTCSHNGMCKMAPIVNLKVFIVLDR